MRKKYLSHIFLKHIFHPHEYEYRFTVKVAVARTRIGQQQKKRDLHVQSRLTSNTVVVLHFLFSLLFLSSLLALALLNSNSWCTLWP